MKSLQERPVMALSRLLGVNKLVPGAAGCSRQGQSNHCSSGGEDHLGIALFCQMITPCWFHYNQVKEGMDLKEAEVGLGMGSSQSAGIAEGLLIVASLIVASLWIERYAARYARYASLAEGLHNSLASFWTEKEVKGHMTDELKYTVFFPSENKHRCLAFVFKFKSRHKSGTLSRWQASQRLIVEQSLRRTISVVTYREGLSN